MALGDVHYCDDFKPDFGIPWVSNPPDSVLMSWPKEKLAEYLTFREQRNHDALMNPVGAGWILPSWQTMMKNWDKYTNHVILGGNRSSKSMIASRLCVWAAGTIPGAEVRAYHVNEDRSIEDQQRMIWDALPDGIRNLPTKKGLNHSVQYSQKNGFTDNICILPPVNGFRRGAASNSATTGATKPTPK